MKTLLQQLNNKFAKELFREWYPLSEYKVNTAKTTHSLYDLSNHIMSATTKKTKNDTGMIFTPSNNLSKISLNNTDKVFDYSAGAGNILIYFADKGHDVAGVEINRVH